MAQIPKFGFSAFLKLLNANPKPQKRLVRDRYRPNKGGYDYHKSLRLRVQQIAFGELSFQQVFDSTSEITKLSERESARRGLKRFFEWKQQNSGAIETTKGLLFPSPKGLYKVEFTPNFLLEIEGRRTAVHLWNTQFRLSGQLVRAALSTVATRYPLENRPDDFAVLSLQDGSIYKWSEADRELALLGEKLLEFLDNQFEVARNELGLSIGPEAPSPHL
ncbi:MULTISPECIES: hypothetical protein [Rhizobium]|uniref:Uncharacterized protein n=1 Tax=Rhizobium tropici TaxID=398 RepID=A0A6P1C5L4_RHITR|nr:MULTISPECIES: hypothetical protein [Rhizobium]AGB70930.1 hypothetical protein RTCIAT899_CH07655 [Rhizobium tropici CIAT 899]MBB4242478.1 hypothetical protein [Rhizobium tropici]MBB5594121.1 hypothetical protein [Rhizobium tropici]MBB6492758.1 hypothetical protein [Rhizobium tropici]NEV11731.1 hypothetical protein [Rhizobium tropici]